MTSEIQTIDMHDADMKLAAYKHARTEMHRGDYYIDGLQTQIMSVGSGTPFAFDNCLKFRKGEVTVWAGINGHGKSLLTGQVILQLAARGERVAIASFEMTPARTMHRMLQQVVNRKPILADAKIFLNEVGTKLFFFDRQGSTTPEELEAAILVAARDCKCKHFFIDNLAKVVAAEDDLNSQKLFIQTCTDIARDLGIHVHVVAHVRKKNTESEALSKFDIRGSSAIIDQPDNVVLIQRNKEKEALRLDGNLTPEEDAEQADTILSIVKQRNAEDRDESIVRLWFNQTGKSFGKRKGEVQWLCSLSPADSKGWGSL